MKIDLVEYLEAILEELSEETKAVIPRELVQDKDLQLYDIQAGIRVGKLTIIQEVLTILAIMDSQQTKLPRNSM